MNNLMRIGKLALIVSLFTMLTGARGCSFATTTTSYDTTCSTSTTNGNVYVGGGSGPVQTVPAVYYAVAQRSQCTHLYNRWSHPIPSITASLFARVAPLAQSS